jgi:hypothetical protein
MLPRITDNAPPILNTVLSKQNKNNIWQFPVVSFVFTFFSFLQITSQNISLSDSKTQHSFQQCIDLFHPVTSFQQIHYSSLPNFVPLKRFP